MIRTLQDFITVWKQEAASTAKLFSGLTDDSIRDAGNATHRDIGRLAWHITGTIREMMERVGLHIDAPDPSSPVPSSAKQLVDVYTKAADSLVTALGGWTDATLEQTDNMYGQDWKRSLTLQILLLHQTHHRGQLTILMRQAGLPLVGMYGPTREEWAQFGMPAPEV